MIDPNVRTTRYLDQVNRQNTVANSNTRTTDANTRSKSTDETPNTRPNETPTGGATSSLTQQDFMRLLTQQLAFQDPFNPVSNDQMVSQMASFSTIDGINKMTDQFSLMNQIMGSGQALQASSLVGQDVLLPTSDVWLEESGVSGAIFSKTGEKLNNLSVRIEDENGQLIKTIGISGEQDGVVRFDWDGTNDSGEKMPAGKYTMKATAEIEGEQKDITDQLATYHRVSSVVLQSELGALINVNGIEGGIPIGNILEVGKISGGSNSGTPPPEIKPLPPIGEIPPESEDGDKPTEEQLLRRFL
ncbi:MAG: flagellar hook assembly protein FlgD [Plesiomonas sp.]|uniref:flagellar hook assembly protein FlgD n=1 Tax=Plesiomonas sp. TaxID=2486279 RepID=UPI003F3467ED